MAYAKLVNSQRVQYAGNRITVGNRTIVNPSAEQYAEAEYYAVENAFVMQTVSETDEETGETREATREVSAAKWYHYEDRFELKQADSSHSLPWIQHTHTAVKDACPDRAALIVKKIRAVYPLDDELAILRQQNNSAAKKAEFDEYNAFCNTCKTQADAEIAEWETA